MFSIQRKFVESCLLIMLLLTLFLLASISSTAQVSQDAGREAASKGERVGVQRFIEMMAR